MKYRLAYTLDQALEEMAAGDPIYELIEGEFERIGSHEELEYAHPHDTFYSLEVTSMTYDIAIANGDRAIQISD